MAYIPWWQRMSPPTFAERFELGGLAGRVGFKDNPLKNFFMGGEDASQKGADISAEKRSAPYKIKVTESIKSSIKDLKARGLSITIETTSTGGKTLTLKVTNEGLKSKFSNLRVPPNTEGLSKIQALFGDIINSEEYKNVKQSKSDVKKLAEKKGKYYQLKRGDPHHVHKKLAREVSEKGKKEIHHSRFKGDAQTLNVMMMVDTQINNLTNLKDAEVIRNKLQTEQKKILKSNQSIEAKQKTLMMINARLTRLKNSLRGTKAAGLLDVKIITMDDKGNINTKFKGADTSKGILFGTEEGKKDLTKIKKGEPTKLVKMASTAIKGGGIGAAPTKQIMLPMILDVKEKLKFSKGGLSGVDQYIINRGI
jgi:hypothetical protein